MPPITAAQAVLALVTLGVTSVAVVGLYNGYYSGILEIPPLPPPQHSAAVCFGQKAVTSSQKILCASLELILGSKACLAKEGYMASIPGHQAGEYAVRDTNPFQAPRLCSGQGRTRSQDYGVRSDLPTTTAPTSSPISKLITGVLGPE